MPEEGRYCYVSILKESLSYASWLSVYGFSERQRLVAEFVEYIHTPEGEGGWQRVLRKSQRGRGGGQV